MTLILAIIPVLLLIVLMAFFKMSGDKSSIISLIVTMLIALFGFAFSVDNLFYSFLYGALKAVSPILIIILMAIFSYNVLLKTEKMEIIKQQFASISTDKSIQVLLLTWGFGGLLEAPLDFVKSIAIAHQKDARIKALLVGEGDMEEETKEAIRQNGIEEYIRTSPFRNDVPDVLHAINVFCLPSLWEGLSIALLEAMAMKKALVVTPTDGTREVITHQESGLIADFGQPEELAECYLTYLHYPEWIESYGNAAMAVIQERFDSRRVSQQVTEVYYDILQ